MLSLGFELITVRFLSFSKDDEAPGNVYPPSVISKTISYTQIRVGLIKKLIPRNSAYLLT